MSFSKKLIILLPLLFIHSFAFAAKPPTLIDIVITEQQALSFPDQIAGFDATVTIGAGDANAAVFSATGEPNTTVVATIVEKNFTMVNAAASGPSSKVAVDTWTWGGSLDASGVATFDGSGNLTNLRVGATANVLIIDAAGIFTGAATLRLTYQ